MNKIIEFSVHNRLFVLLLVIALIIGGLKAFQTLSIDAVPDITNTQVQINTSVHGLVPEEVERMITVPLEYNMSGLPGVEGVRSVSKYGISQVTVIFKDGFDIYKARQLISEQLQGLDLPQGATPQMGPIATGLGEIFHYAVEAKDVAAEETQRLKQLMELRTLQEWVIKPRLLALEGVTEVNTIGGFKKQYFIQPNIHKMALYGIHFDDIEKALNSTNKNVGGGYIQQTGEQLLVRGIGLLGSIKDIEDVIVKRLSTFNLIRIKDIAEVKLDKEIRTGAATVNAQESVIGTTFMLLGENSRAVATRVRDKLNIIKSELPDWVTLETLYDRSNMVNATLTTVQKNLLFGALLVIVVLLSLVGNLRAALITAVTIPLSLLATFVLMQWKGVSGNLMSLGALDFGIIVDGTVIVVENCVRRIKSENERLGRTLSRAEVKSIVVNATSEIRKAAGFGELIVIVTFIPLFALTGVEGRMFAPMAMTFIMALVSALILSFTVVPALAATFLAGHSSQKTPLLMIYAEKLFRPVLTFALNAKKWVLGIGLCSIIVGGLLFLRLGAEFIPQLDEGDFSLQFIRPANISADNSVKLQQLSEKVIKAFPQVKTVFSKIGASEINTDPMGINISDTYVILKPKNQWPTPSEIKTKDDLIREMTEQLELKVPAQVIMASQPVQLRFNELLEGTRADVSAKIFGDDLNKLIRLSKDLANIVRDVPGYGSAESESKGLAPLLQYSADKNELARLGITSQPLLETVETALGGRQMGYLYEGVRRFPIVTRLSEHERKDVEALQNLPVGVSEGYTVPISQVAHIDFIETYSDISRENSQRRIAVLINPKTRDIETFVNTAQSLVKQRLDLPENYYIEWGGAFKNLIQAKQRLSLLLPLALLVILCMLYAAFKNFSQVALIFMCAPMALIGGVVSLNLMGMPFSISAGVGFIALCGISILNGVVLVSYFNRLYSKHKSADAIAKEGAISRLRPVLMTAITDIFGFLPMMFSTGLGAEVQKPLATVVVGGMISSTLLTLLVLPTLYSMFFKYMTIKETPST